MPFRRGTKTFCLTKASTGEEQPSPFLVKSLYFPAGWPGHSLFFSYYKRSQLQHAGKKKSSPRPRQGPVAAAATWLASCGGQRWLQPPAPTGRGPEPQLRAKATAGARGRVREVSASTPNLLLPRERASIRPSQGVPESLLSKAEEEKPGPPSSGRIQGFGPVALEGPLRSPNPTSWLGRMGRLRSRDTHLPKVTLPTNGRADP